MIKVKRPVIFTPTQARLGFTLFAGCYIARPVRYRAYDCRTDGFLVDARCGSSVDARNPSNATVRLIGVVAPDARARFPFRASSMHLEPLAALHKQIGLDAAHIQADRTRRAKNHYAVP